MPPWSLQNSKNWKKINMLKKIVKEKKYFLHRATTTAWATHKKSETKSKFHVPRYMEFCFFFKPMYPGTWYYVFSSNLCTRVHGILILLQIHVPWNMKFGFCFTILMCSSGGGGGPVQKIFFFFANFFQHVIFFSIFGIL